MAQVNEIAEPVQTATPETIGAKPTEHSPVLTQQEQQKAAQARAEAAIEQLLNEAALEYENQYIQQEQSESQRAAANEASQPAPAEAEVSYAYAEVPEHEQFELNLQYEPILDAQHEPLVPQSAIDLDELEADDDEKQVQIQDILQEIYPEPTVTLLEASEQIVDTEDDKLEIEVEIEQDQHIAQPTIQEVEQQHQPPQEHHEQPMQSSPIQQHQQQQQQIAEQEQPAAAPITPPPPPAPTTITTTVESTAADPTVQNNYLMGMSKLNKSTAQERDYRGAYYYLNLAAEKGHILAREELAIAQLFGDHIERDLAMARATFDDIATRNGSARSQFYLGFMYASGLGLASNQAKAILYFTFAALGGEHMAQMALGYRYMASINVVGNCEIALSQYRAVATSVATKISHTSVGTMVHRIRLYDEEEKVGANTNQLVLDDDLFEYYQLLADRGDVQAQYGISNC